ncbi:MAG: serine/threonine protein kinase [Gemmatimonadota bacterium]|nr:serine/threonine protein kinase [Gemmatimonadota bacterium]MDH4351095.1 serine/threonine protein kinase [Gemmatimonadota bacterium]MDH5198648.1 serine/threonine protein kinase [Gemmatimonadota bacterium]
MTDTSPRCAGCGRLLDPDDQFCSKCGSPTASKVDPEATIVVAAGSENSSALSGQREVTAPDAMPEPAAPPSGADFNTRLRHVLGAEYEILSLLGQGGFARVYRARDRRLDRMVAIKVIRPDVVGTKMFVESFRTEGIALAKLRHPGIIPIYDIREREGLIYYVMPFVEGTTLEARLDRGKLPPYESRRILSELAEALTAAHRVKMAHLDIKPANVFLEGDLGKVLLMDFGTAMAVTEVVEESSGGPVVGTPEYMSPEQARGLPDIDHRSDIYSLGALGYRMLMGRPPFSGRNATEILEKHVTEAPVPIRDVNPTIPKEFADAIMHCLEKDPWDRFSTAKELDGVLQGVTFRSTQEHVAPGAASSGVHGTIVAVIAVVALLVGLLVGVAIG